MQKFQPHTKYEIAALLIQLETVINIKLKNK